MPGALRAKVGGAWVDISMAGPQGAPGPQGIAGPQGAQGPPGVAEMTVGIPITGGTAGRVLFEGTGPVLMDDGGLVYDPITNTLTAGNLVTNGLLTNGIRSVPLTPPQITANTDDYAPGTALDYRLSSDISRYITGLSVGQVDGQQCELWNIGTVVISLFPENTNSLAANRFITPANQLYPIWPGDQVVLRYFAAEFGGTGRWRISGVVRPYGYTEMAGSPFQITAATNVWQDVTGFAQYLQGPHAWRVTVDCRAIIQDTVALSSIRVALKVNGTVQSSSEQMVAWATVANSATYGQTSKTTIFSVPAGSPVLVQVVASRTFSGTITYSHLYSDTGGRCTMAWEKI